MFAIYQIMLGLKACKYYEYYETDEIPQPEVNPTQEKLGKKWHLGHFFRGKYVFVGWDWSKIGNRLET